ncbi:MAG TPA: DUF4209 domain-containing protein [Solirubrobacteraceae bacterium]|nr:DUF4209 domain-containing protein [Solirubrobacteraceae bacterium]
MEGLVSTALVERAALGDRRGRKTKHVPIPKDLLARLRAALAGAEDWYSVESAFTKAVRDDEVDAARPAAYAFGYMLIDEHNEESRSRNGVFAPRIEWQGGHAFPPPLDQLTPEVKDVWVELFEQLDGSSARARLGDLLWVTRHGPQPHAAGRAATASYIALVGDLTWSDRVGSVLRAVELATELNDTDLRREAVEVAVEFAEAELDQAEWRPGLVLRVLERLAALKQDQRPAGLRELADRVRDRYAADPFITESVIELQLSLAEADERELLRDQQVQRWRDAAEEEVGLTRLAHLRHAHERARAIGRSDTATEIALEIEQISAEDLDLQRQEVKIEIPAGELDRLVQSFTEHESAADALGRFGVEGPPSGHADELDRAVAELAERYPIQRLISRQVLGEHNALVFEARTPDDHDRMDRAQYAALGIQFFGPIADRILKAIRDGYEHPDTSALTDFFTTDLISESIAGRLAEAVGRYWDGDDVASALILVTQIEAALRDLTAKLGVPVTKPPRGGTPGGVIALGAVLDKLAGRLDESWRRYLLYLLSEPLAVNLRNRLAHGLLSNPSALDVAVLIHAACFLRSLGVDTQVKEPPSADPT